MVAYYVLFSLIRQLFLDKFYTNYPTQNHTIQSKNYYADAAIAFSGTKASCNLHCNSSGMGDGLCAKAFRENREMAINGNIK